jgi:hypothetical protein
MIFGWWRESSGVRLLASCSWRWLMPSVLCLLEAREKKVRAEVARLREEAERITTALCAAEAQLERLGQARETVTEVLAEPDAGTAGQVEAAAVMGSTVPHRVEGVGAQVLAPE